MNTHLELAGLVALCSFAGMASAADTDATRRTQDVPTRAVKYDAQSLGDDDAVRSLYSRIVAASREVCPDVSVGHLWISQATAQCRKEAVARAVMQVNNPRLAALHVTRAKTG